MDKYMDIQLFADGGAGAAGGDGGAAAESNVATGVKVPVAEGRRQKRENPLANVKYGRQPQDFAQGGVAPADDGAANQTEANDGSRKSFDDLIKGDYKADFDAKVQDIIRNRFKANAENEQKLSSMNPLLELLGRKYNVDPQDIEKLTQIIGDDDSLYEQEALERGMSVDSLKTVKQLEQRNQALEAEKQQTIAEMQMRQHFDSLARQAEEAKQLYPNLDLMTEMQNPTFARLTSPSGGVDVRTAYEVVHREEMRGAEMQFAAQKSVERVANAVRSNSARPTENGMKGKQSAAVVKTDPSTWTKEDRAEVKRRVLRGDKIVL